MPIASVIRTNFKKKKKMRHILAITVLLFLTTFLSFSQSDKATTLIDDGVALYDQGKYTEAIDKYKESYKLDSNSVVLFSELAMTYLALKDYVNTEKTCKRAISKFANGKGMENIYCTFGNSLDERQNHEEALKTFSEGISKFPNYFMLYFNKGITEYNLKRYYAARTSFQNAIRLNPKKASSYYYLGIIEAYFENRIPAILTLSRFLVLEPKGKRAEVILPYLTKKVNSMYYQQKTGDSTAIYSSAKARIDTIKSSFLKVEENLLILATTSAIPGIGKEGETEIKKFEIKLQTISELLEAYKKDSSDFYWDFLAPYFIDMEKQKFVKTFTYHINHFATNDKDIENWFKNNEKEVDKFYEWNKNFKW